MSIRSRAPPVDGGISSRHRSDDRRISSQSGETASDPIEQPSPGARRPGRRGSGTTSRAAVEPRAELVVAAVDDHQVGTAGQRRQPLDAGSPACRPSWPASGRGPGAPGWPPRAARRPAGRSRATRCKGRPRRSIRPRRPGRSRRRPGGSGNDSGSGDVGERRSGATSSAGRPAPPAPGPRPARRSTARDRCSQAAAIDSARIRPIASEATASSARATAGRLAPSPTPRRASTTSIGVPTRMPASGREIGPFEDRQEGQAPPASKAGVPI